MYLQYNNNMLIKNKKKEWYLPMCLKVPYHSWKVKAIQKLFSLKSGRCGREKVVGQIN
jgi:hypothetical protein